MRKLCSDFECCRCNAPASIHGSNRAIFANSIYERRFAERREKRPRIILDASKNKKYSRGTVVFIGLSYNANNRRVSTFVCVMGQRVTSLNAREFAIPHGVVSDFGRFDEVNAHQAITAILSGFWKSTEEGHRKRLATVKTN